MTFIQKSCAPNIIPRDLHLNVTKFSAYYNNITLNLEKCKFLKEHLDFFGFQFTTEGKRADPKKVTDFANTPMPTNVSEVRSLLGMSNFCSQFIPDYATITTPLCELTKKNTTFKWSEASQAAYDKLKIVLTVTILLTIY